VRLIRGLHNLRAGEFATGSAVSIGKYDGVHLGHRKVLAGLVEKARELAVPAVAVIFEPLPQEYFARLAGKPVPARLGNLRERLTDLADCGLDAVLLLKFDARFPQWPAADFIDQLLVRGLGTRYLVVGDDFRFGAGREGDFDLLTQAGAEQGFSVTATATCEADGLRVSSGRIREALAANDLDLAKRLLGRPWRVQGRVIHGDARGRQLGWPTANVRMGRECAPVRGVFAVEVSGGGLLGAPAMANLGLRPTVDGHSESLEVHIFDLPKETDLYGQILDVEFRHHLRDEVKFDSLDALKAQINRDAQVARDWFSSN